MQPEIVNTSFGGTSAACPIVAGVAVLMRSVNPQLTPKQIKEILITTANKNEKYPPDAVGYHSFVGYGMVDAYNAVYAAIHYKPNTMPEVVEVPFQTVLKFHKPIRIVKGKRQNFKLAGKQRIKCIELPTGTYKITKRSGIKEFYLFKGTEMPDSEIPFVLQTEDTAIVHIAVSYTHLTLPTI